MSFEMKVGEHHRTAQELLNHLLAMQARGIDLAKIDVWGWDDETVIMYDTEELYGRPDLDFKPKPYNERKQY